MADLQPCRFEPERVPNPEDSESENEEVNDQLEGSFWCSCERCQIENVFVVENSQRKKTKFNVEFYSSYCIGCSKWKNNFFCNLL